MRQKMISKEFSKHQIKEFEIERKGSGLYIKGAHPLPEEIDYNDDDSVKTMASKAAKTADGFYSLIKNNCNTENPSVSSNARLEMYLALAGLVCEIYMKSIIYFENRHGCKQCRGHKLNELFALMPDSHKNELIHGINGIESILPDIGNAFESLRYDYELNHIQGNYLLLFDLMEVLHSICDRYPKRTVGEMRYVNEALAFE